MTDIKERLELLEKQNEMLKARAYYDKGYKDALQTNGVTIQEWISVEERLPDEDGDYITMTNASGKGKGVLFHRYETNYVRGKELRRWYWNGRLTPWIVTHWMPLPQPPKGE